MDKHAKLSDGFTIIETLVSLMLLMILLVILLTGLMNAMLIDTRNLLRLQAKTIAQECMERLRSEKLILTSGTDCNAVGVPVSNPCSSGAGVNQYSVPIRGTNYEFRIAWALSSTGVANLEEANVVVCWNFVGKEYRYSLKSYIKR